MNPGQQALSNDQAIASMIGSFSQGSQSDDVFGAPGQQQQYQQAGGYQGYQIAQPTLPPAPVQQQQFGQPQYQQQIPGQMPQQPYLQPGVQMPQQGQPQHQQPGQMQMQPVQQPQGPLPQYQMQVPQIPVQPVQPQQPQQQQQLTQEQIQQIIAQYAQQAGQQQPQPGDDWPDRPTTWGGLRKTTEQIALEKAQEVLKGHLEQQAQAENEKRAQLAQGEAELNAMEDQLRQYQMLPPIVNPLDPNDAGLLAQRELEGFAASMGTSNLWAAASSLKAHHDQGYYYDNTRRSLVRRGSQTAAAHAPIAGASPSLGPVAGQAGPSQRDLMTGGLSLDNVLAQGMASLQY